jgi:hypothetical protein
VSIADPSLYGEPLARAEAEARLALAADWRLPTATEQAAFKGHRRLSVIADFLIAAADVADESWILLERVWAGFPDPPAFAFFAYRADGSTICEADLDEPSRLWRLPEGVLTAVESKRPALTERERSMIWREVPLGNGRTVLLLNYPDTGAELSPDEVNRNVVCVDEQGNVVWRVKPPTPFQPSGDPYVTLEFDGTVLKASRFFGDICEVSQTDGLATKIGWTK